MSLPPPPFDVLTKRLPDGRAPLELQDFLLLNQVATSGGAPAASKYVVGGIADASLTNAQFLGALATGIAKITTVTGTVSIAVAGDFPTLNQNTTGSAAKLTTARTIAGVSFDGTANITIASTNLSDVTAWTNWTPVITFGGGSTGQTFTLQVGRYCKIGTLVIYYARILFSNKGSSTGAAILTGFPSSSTATSGATPPSAVWGNNFAIGVADLTTLMNTGATTMTLYKFGAGVITGLADTDFANNTDFAVSGSYEAA